MITLKDGRTYTGTPLQILRHMKQLAFNGGQTIDEYIDYVVENTLRYEGIDLKVTGSTEEERAASLIDEMLRVGLAKRS